MGLPVVAWLAVPWPAGCRDRERVPAAESGAAADQGRSGRSGFPDLTGRRLAATIVIGRHRQRLSSFTDRGAWLRGVGLGPVVGGALAGRQPASRATAGGTWRRCGQVAIEAPEFTRSDRPAAAGDDRHQAPPATAVDSRRSRRLASWGCPWSRGWRCLGRPAAGIASNCRRNLAPLPAGSDRGAEFARSDRPILAMIAIWRPRERLSSLPDRGARLHGLPVVEWLAVPWPAGCRDRERVPAAESGAAADQGRSGRPGLPDLTGRLWR